MLFFSQCISDQKKMAMVAKNAENAHLKDLLAVFEVRFLALLLRRHNPGQGKQTSAGVAESDKFGTVIVLEPLEPY